MSGRKKAFTVIDVIVGICGSAFIAGILLPARTMSTQAAAQVSCQANLKLIGEAMSLYNSQHKMLPWAFASENGAGGPWTRSLAIAMGGNSPGNIDSTGKGLQMFRCPAATVQNAEARNNMQKYRPVSHYSGNWRAFPYAGDDGYTWDRASAPVGGQPTDKVHLRSLESIHHPASVAMVFDAGQIESKGWTAEPTTRFLGFMEECLPFGIYPSVDPAQWSEADYDRPLPLGNDGVHGTLITQSAETATQEFNIDMADLSGGRGSLGYPAMKKGPTGGIIRYRHGNNDTVNVLWADGHVEPRKIGELKVRDVCMNYK